MNEELIKILESLGYPTYMQGSLGEDEPESFFTFWNFSADDSSHYDNDAKEYEIGYWVYFYSTNPLLPDEMLLKARKVLKENDFVVTGPGRSVMAHRQEFTGKVIEVYKITNY